MTEEIETGCGIILYMFNRGGISLHKIHTSACVAVAKEHTLQIILYTKPTVEHYLIPITRTLG